MSDKPSKNAQILEWLDRAEQHATLGGSARRYALLRYLVNEEIEGRGAQIKAYAIALDVMGRPADFDPSTDSIVRVEVARLRDALELYYARSSHAADPIVEIPKGGYRPIITLPPPSTVLAPAASLNRWLAFGMAACLCLLVLGIVGFLLQPRTGGPVAYQDEAPILEVAKLKTMATGKTANQFAAGFRQQLLTDLSHLPTIVVRDGPLQENTVGRDAVRPPNYLLSVVSLENSGGGFVSLQLMSLPDQTLSWARTIETASESETFYDDIQWAVQGIGQEIAGSYGTITREQTRYSISAARTSPEATPGEYRCLVISLSYDATKDDSLRDMSQSCLAAAVAAGTQNATLLAQHSHNLFLRAVWSENSEIRAALLARSEDFAHKAVTLNPNDSMTHEALGNAFSANGKRVDAIAAYARAIELAPSRPAPHFLQGWQTVLQGDWDTGMKAVNMAIAMQPEVPGYMFVPLALDAFRCSDYKASLEKAQAVIERGDKRGYALAFAASLAMGDTALADAYFADPKARTATDPSDPMREVRISFSNPDVITKYDRIIAGYMRN